MNFFAHILTAILVGLLFAGAWASLYALALAFIWIAGNLSFFWVIALVFFISGTGFYLVDNASV